MYPSKPISEKSTISTESIVAALEVTLQRASYGMNLAKSTPQIARSSLTALSAPLFSLVCMQQFGRNDGVIGAAHSAVSAGLEDCVSSFGRINKTRLATKQLKEVARHTAKSAVRAGGRAALLTFFVSAVGTAVSGSACYKATNSARC